VVIRHLGIPTVTTPMGVMSDIGMPVGLTFAGRSYEDTNLLSFAWAFDDQRNRRLAPSRTPEIPAAEWTKGSGGAESQVALLVTAKAGPAVDGWVSILVEIETNAAEVSVSVNGASQTAQPTATGYNVEAKVQATEHTRMHSEWRGGYGSVVVVLARTGTAVVGDYQIVCGV
jgi:amidase